MYKSTKALGDKYELLATKFLKKRGYTILKRNYRYKRFEIDIIARDNNILVFVEVKMRGKNYFGEPEESVSDTKASNVITAAQEYIEDSKWLGNIRFDIISILRNRGEIRHFKDAFY